MTNLDTERANCERFINDEVTKGYLCRLTDDAIDMFRFGWLARAEAGGWRPISEAPREHEKRVLLYCPNDYDEPCIGWWHDGRGYHFLKGSPADGGLHNGFYTDHNYIVKPTHFRPLPAPPKEDGE